MVIVVIVIIIISGATAIEKKRVSSLLEKENLTDEEFIENIKVVYGNQSRKYSGVYVNILTEGYGYQSNNDYSDYEVKWKELLNNEIAINIKSYVGIFGEKNPIEIESCFAVYLYLEKVKWQNPITAISCYYHNGMDDAGWGIAITKEEFEELRDSTDIEGLSREKAAKKLAEKWIEQTGYVKR